MDNVTHAFVGAAMAECAVPREARSRTRLALLCAGVVAANAPDVDLLYTGITEEPLGYLLHHRGHSHTLPALIALCMLIWAGVRVSRSLRWDARVTAARWLLLIAAALASHVLMDTANGYGTHLFYPFSSKWVYGDAVFVLEPWLWAILGVTVALNARPRPRALLLLLTLALIGAAGAVGILHRGMLAVIVAVIGAAALITRSWERRRRAAAALIVTSVIFLAMPVISRAAKGEARRAVADVDPGSVVDILADANPGVPWCWGVLTLQRQNDAPDVLIARRATLSLMPRIWPAASCASARLSARRSADLAVARNVVWHRRWQIDADSLRALAVANCRVRAWLQFGRVPYVANGRIADLRFEAPIGQNFTSMPLEGASGCPTHVTNWEWPRADVLSPP